MESTSTLEAGPAVGIDLGTTYSCVAVMTAEKIEIIPNEQGNNTMPSYVAFNKDQRLIGEAAKSQESRNTKNTVFDAKRLIGNHFSNPQVQKDMKHWGFKVKAAKTSDEPVIEVTVNGEQKDFQPEEISSMVLSKMAKVAEDYLQKKITKAVVTVPAYFNDSQRQATKDAGTIAGLEVLRIINEPTAAAIAYGLDKAKNESQNVLIFDLGGGTFDVSILTIEDGVFAVKATNGDTHLGGNDFDMLMVDFCIKTFKDKHNIDLSTNDRAKSKLSQACEKAKRILSTATQALIEVEAISDDKDFELTFSRSKFEELCQSVFDRAFAPVTAVMKDSGMTKNQINEVVLVGGSTRIPKVQTMLSEFFSGKTLNKSIHPDEAVAYGAAVQAAILTGQQTETCQDIVLLDVTPLSLGLELKGGLMDVVIPRNSTIPKRTTKTYYTTEDGQTEMDNDIYQGERAMAKDNACIAKSMINGITPAKSGEIKVKETFDIDANGILNVFACEYGNESKTQMHVTVNTNKSRLSSDQVKKMQDDAEKYAAEDAMHIKRVNKRNDVEEGLYQIKTWLREDEERGRFKEDEAELMAEIYRRGMDYLDQNPRATFNDLKACQEKADDKMRPMALRYNLFVQHKERRGGNLNDSESDE